MKALRGAGSVSLSDSVVWEWFAGEQGRRRERDQALPAECEIGLFLISKILCRPSSRPW